MAPTTKTNEEELDLNDLDALSEGPSQLSFAIGGAKPKSSELKLNAKQVNFGVQRQFKRNELIKISGTARVSKIVFDETNKGIVKRMQFAVIEELTIHPSEE